MKGFFLGVLATVVATIVGYLAIEGVKRIGAPAKEVTVADFDPKFYFSAEDAAEWQKGVQALGVESLDGQQRLVATAVTVENSGGQPLEKQRVIVRPKENDEYAAGIITFQNDAIPGVLGDDTKMIVKNKSLYIDYNLLDTEEIHRFWVVHDKYSTLDIIARTPGLRVSSWTGKIYLKKSEEDWSDWWFFGGLAGALIIFVGGFWAADRNARGLIEAQGLNYDDLISEGLKAKKVAKQAAKND